MLYLAKLFSIVPAEGFSPFIMSLYLPGFLKSHPSESYNPIKLTPNKITFRKMRHFFKVAIHVFIEVL